MTTPHYLNDAYLKEMETVITEISKEIDQQQRWMIVHFLSERRRAIN
ncbi:MAG: hypothetical protein WC222_05480 [Parachlamydiales bacterium]|jgi:hypothetical protein